MICAIWGAEKTGKTTLALTFPPPIVHFDIDVGGFSRAAMSNSNGDYILGNGMKVKAKSEPFAVPLQISKLLGKGAADPSIRISPKVVGMRELWQRFLQAYVAALEDKTVNTIIIDSGTGLWEIVRQSYLQEKQEAQEINGVIPANVKYRESLQSIEYAEPNNRMRSVIYAPRTFNKNLILTHYPREVYAQRLTERGVMDVPTGQFEIDGYKYTSALVDLLIMTQIKVIETGIPPVKRALPVGTITLSGVGLSIVGSEIPDPTYEKIINLVNMARGL